MRGIYAGLCLYLFLAALNVLGAGLGTFGRASDFLTQLFAYGENPFIALLAGTSQPGATFARRAGEPGRAGRGAER